MHHSIKMATYNLYQMVIWRSPHYKIMMLYGMLLSLH